MKIIKGRVWKFGDNVDTDCITPSQYLLAPFEEMKKHALEAVNPSFAKEVKAGDVIVAGHNFGCGSSRETAPSILKTLGLGAIVAESFGRIFFRNAIAIGLIVLECRGISSVFRQGDKISIDMKTWRITNLNSGITCNAQPLPELVLKVLAKGGILPILKELAQTGNLRS